MGIKDKNPNSKAVDMKSRVMNKIEEEKITMRHPLIFLAQKLGMQSVLVMVIVLGALVVDTGFYLIKKTGSFGFLSLGAPGRHIFLKSFPYDYLALFIVTLIIANYLFKKLDLSRGLFLFANAPMLLLFSISVLAGLFFGKMGIGEIIKDRTVCMLPKETAAHGEIVEVSKNEVLIKTGDGHLEKVVLGKGLEFTYDSEHAKGKFLRATGFLDKKDPSIFHAEQFRCCDVE